ncbi:protein I'm not dead yet-like [Epargyreus clarus]|uniref:protein I'm not dead yet-like n=1 Tax=Epargyreus clarus TaxID=520877 RepID=UPI003C2EFFE0
MGGFTSMFRGDPRTPVGIVQKFKHIIRQHPRGLVGCIVPLVVLPWLPEKGKNDITVQCMWMWMFWSFLVQPVNIPVTGFIPLFLLPMTGVLSSAAVCQCYFNENIVLFIIGGMLVLLMNNSGVDRRIALWLICSGDACQFSGKRLVFKASTAAFFLSMFGNRLIATSTIIQYLTPALTNLQSLTSRYRSTEPDYDEMRYIIINSIQTASAIGSTAIMHSAFATLAMRAIWCESPPQGKEYPDIFNYLQYSVFAFPVAFLMFVLNFAYHMFLINWYVIKPMSASSMNEMRKALLKHKSALSKRVTSHEKLSVFFTLFALVMLIFRWCEWLDMGWTTFAREESSPKIPGVKDATVVSIFVLALHVLPRTFGFMKFLTAQKKSELGVLKPDSSIMWWRFVDKNTNYGYVLLLGGGIALNTAIRESELAKTLAEHLGKKITGYTWNTSVLAVVLVAVILANLMSGVAACCVFLPFVINMVITTL